MILSRLKFCFLLALLCLFTPLPRLRAQAPSVQPKTVFLWPNGVPGALGNTPADQPRMYVFLPGKRSTSAAILIIPGGAYHMVVMGSAGFQIADWLNQQGMAAMVLDYRIAPYHYPAEIDDGRRAMRLIRAHAAEWGIDPNRIGVWGSSAGGHLASSLGTHCEGFAQVAASGDPIDQFSCKPNFMILEYPVISMEPPEAHARSRRNFLGPDPDPKLAHEYSNQFAVTPTTPPTFLFATTNDPTVPVANTLDFYRALVQNHVHAELHLFDYSRHGCGLCGDIPSLSVWPALLRTWLIDHSYLPPDAPSPPPPSPHWPKWPAGLEGPGKP